MNGLRWRNRNFRLGVKVAIGFAVAALAAHGVFGPDGLMTYMQKRREYDALHMQIKQAEQQNQQLQKEVLELKSNPAAIERYAREDLHMARAKEMIYVLPTPAQKTSHPTSSRASGSP